MQLGSSAASSREIIDARVMAMAMPQWKKVYIYVCIYRCMCAVSTLKDFSKCQLDKIKANKILRKSDASLAVRQAYVRMYMCT